jgi:hypothetical protein
VLFWEYGTRKGAHQVPVDWEKQTYTEAQGGAFMKGEEWNRLVYTDAVIEITAVREKASRFNPNPDGTPSNEWVVDFVAPDGEPRSKSFAQTNSERNERIEEFRALLDAGEESVRCTPVKVGKRDDFGPPNGE